MQKLRKRMVPDISIIFVLFIIVIPGLFHYVFYHTKLDIYNSSIRDAEVQYHESLWSMTDSTIKIANAVGKEKGIELSKVLVDKIRANNDIHHLKDALDSGNYAESGFFYTVHNTIRGNWLLNINNSNNDVFVLYRDNILIDTTANADGRIYQDLESFISNHYNPELAKVAFNAMLRGEPSDIIFMENNPGLSEHMQLASMNKYALKKIIETEGINGLRGYEILLPIYITDDGDIFGTRDITKEGIVSKNHKMILVQTYNLYDMLSMYNSSEIESINSNYNIMKKNYERIVQFANVSYLAIMLMDMVAILLVLFYTTRYKKDS